MLVLAGPGTGKTATIVEAAVARLTDPQDPLPASAVLILTFGRRAAHEVRDRITARLGAAEPPTVATFHSFCYGLMRQWSQTLEEVADAEPLRLLTGPEQELRLREMLDGSVSEGRGDWPDDLRRALDTRAAITEIRAVLARTRALGLDPEELAALGRRHGVPGWAAVGTFAEEYLQVLAMEGVTDYTELIHGALLLAHRPQVRQHLHATYRAIFVDEYQDTDPAQVRLLRAIAGPEASLVVVGDPDQAIYAFRGADVSGLLGFREQFATPGGPPVEVVVLDRTRRFGPVLREGASRILGDRALPGLPVEAVRRHRSPECEAGHPGSIEVHVYDDDSARAAHVADLLRRARFDRPEGAPAMPWSQMAVLVRSGVQHIPTLRRALVAAGVPVEVAGDELPLHAEPAVAGLLLAMRVAADPRALTADAAAALLLSPIAGLDPSELRRVGRALRRAAPEAASAELVRAAVAGEPVAADIPADPQDPLHIAWQRVQRLADLLADARRLVAALATAEEVLWELWSRSGGDGPGSWSRHLEQAALGGGVEGVRADRDLDAVCALMDTVQRASERMSGVRGITAILAEIEAQEFTADTLAERAVRGEAVRILTAHRAKGLQWPLVIVVGAEEGVWPDLRVRGSLLLPDRLTRHGLGDPPRPAEVLAEERRLFYVACTRAQERLIVATVGSAQDDGVQPSRFIDDLCGSVIERQVVRGRPRRPLSPAGLIASLRAAAVDEHSSPALRRAAIERLAGLATGSSVPHLAQRAHPRSWWGLAEPTRSEVPLRPVDEPVRLSGTVIAGVQDCPRRWVLGHEAGGSTRRGSGAAVGSIVHALAERLGTAELTLAEATDLLDEVWPHLPYEAAWQSAAERAAVDRALELLLAYQDCVDRELLATEADFGVEVPLAEPDDLGQSAVRLTGSIDRVERDAQGRLVAVDLKTGRRPPSATAVRTDAQLATYQVALGTGEVALGGADASAAPVGGAELVQLRAESAAGLPLRQDQPPVDPGWVGDLLGSAARMIRAEQFPATPGDACRTCPFLSSCPQHARGGEVTRDS